MLRMTANVLREALHFSHRFIHLLPGTIQELKKIAPGKACRPPRTVYDFEIKKFIYRQLTPADE
jgi:hypothetical protein